MKNSVNIKEKSDEELIHILETQDDYQDFLIKMAKEELTARNLSQDKIKTIAEELYRKKSEELLNKTSDYEGLDLPDSELVPQHRKVLIFKRVHQEVIKRKNIFKGNAGGYIA